MLPPIFLLLTTRPSSHSPQHLLLACFSAGLTPSQTEWLEGGNQVPFRGPTSVKVPRYTKVQGWLTGQVSAGQSCQPLHWECELGSPGGWAPGPPHGPACREGRAQESAGASGWFPGSADQSGESRCVDRWVPGGGGRHEGTTSNPASQTQDPYLIQGHVPNGCAIDLQDPVSNMDGILHIWAHAAWVHSVGRARAVVRLLPAHLSPRALRGNQGDLALTCVISRWQWSRTWSSGLVRILSLITDVSAICCPTPDAQGLPFNTPILRTSWFAWSRRMSWMLKGSGFLPHSQTCLARWGEGSHSSGIKQEGARGLPWATITEWRWDDALD